MSEMNISPIFSTVEQRFIGRKEALDHFYSCFTQRETFNGVYYHGRGGVGKTWILRKILLDTRKKHTCHVPDIIDFFDTKNGSLLGLQDTICRRLDMPHIFEPYDHERRNLENLRKTTASISVLESTAERVNQVFMECCQAAVGARETVLLFDTFERVQLRYVGDWLIKNFFPVLHDAILVITGRDDAGPAAMPPNIQSIQLSGLNQDEATQYIHLLAPETSPQSIQAISDHTEGSPLHIELIMDLPMQKREQFIAQLSSLKEHELIQKNPDIERDLVGQFAYPMSQRNMLIWIMTYLHRRFDLPMLRYIVEKSQWFQLSPYEHILEELSRSVYIKEYPAQQSHLLHDEIRRMVQEYILNAVVDPIQEIYQPLYELVVNQYYPERIADSGEEDANQLRAERLGYILDRHPKDGLDMYQEFEKEIYGKTKNYDFEELLWGQVRDYLDNLKPQQQVYPDWFVRGRLLTENNRLNRAIEHLEAMLGLFPEKILETSLSLGNVMHRQGKYENAREILIAKLPLAEQDGDFDMVAGLENMLGQNERAAGDWNQALLHYNRGFRAATHAQNDRRMIDIYINRAYLYSLMGKFSEAIGQCHYAIQQLRQLPESSYRTLRECYAYLNQAMIERHERNYPQAQEHYEASLRMAQKSADLQPICEALQGMGINLHLIGRELRRNRDNLSDAIDKQIAAYQLIREALEKAGTADKARGLIADGLNRIAKIFREARHLHSAAESGKALPAVGERLDQLDRMLADFQPPFEDEYRESLVMKGPAFCELNYLEKAQRLFEISALLARSVNDHYREMDSLTETARLLMWLNHLDEALMIIHRLESVPASQAQSKVFKAASDLALAHLYFCQEKYPESLALFQDAISRLANMTGYPAYLLTDRVRDLEWRLRDLQPEQALAWCDALENAWENSQAISSRPDLRDTIERIRLEKQALSGGS